MTYSIVARDPGSGDLGVAVQSHWFAVGAMVAWAEPGVGVVATQSFVEVAYGRLGLERLRAGQAPAAALADLLAADGGRAVRQVALLDTAGRAAAHTGEGCLAACGHLAGDGWSVQANMMANERVVPAMAEAWQGSRGDLAARLLAVLDAAEAAGGDVRGRQSAALKIVRGVASAEPSHDVVFDLRVDDHAEPLADLRRLVGLARVYDAMNAGDRAMERNDLAAARDLYAAAAAAAPERAEVRYWQAITLALAGDLAAALPILADLYATAPRWRTLTTRLESIVPATLLARLL